MKDRIAIKEYVLIQSVPNNYSKLFISLKKEIRHSLKYQSNGSEGLRIALWHVVFGIRWL